VLEYLAGSGDPEGPALRKLLLLWRRHIRKEMRRNIINAMRVASVGCCETLAKTL
jgi:hypothetical protein